MHKKECLLFCICVYLLSCTKGTPPIPDVQIHYIDPNGNDLFTDGQNGYYKDTVAILNIDGNKIPNYVDFVEWTPSTLETGPSAYTTITNNYCTLIIHLRYGTDDTLKFHETSKQLGGTIDSIWYNGRLKKAGTQVIDSVSNPDLYTTLFTVVH